MTIEAATGTSLTLGGFFADTTFADSKLLFDSALDAGAISLAPSFMSVGGDDAIPVDGGRVSLGGAGASVFGGATSIPVGATSARAVVDLAGNALTAANLSGSGVGFIVNSSATATLSTANAVNSTFAGVLSNGVGKFAIDVLAAPGVLTLTGVSNYTGGTKIESGGTPQIGAGATGAIAGAVDDEGALIFARSNGCAFAGAISGAGGVTQAGVGVLMLTRANGFTGRKKVLSGTLGVASGGAINASSGVTFSAKARLRLQGGASICAPLTLSSAAVGNGGALQAFTAADSVTGAVTLAGGATLLAVAGQQLIVSAAMGGTGLLPLSGAGKIIGSGPINLGAAGLVKSGAGVVLISGVGGYTGATNVVGGVLQLSGGAAIADSATVAVHSGAQLQVFANETVASISGAGSLQLAATLALGGDNSNSTFSGAASDGAGPGALDKLGTGELTLSGEVAIEAGVVAFSQTQGSGPATCASTARPAHCRRPQPRRSATRCASPPGRARS